MLARTIYQRPEVILVAPFLVIFAAGLASGLPLLLPDGGSLTLIERHYFRPLLLVLLALGLAIFTAQKIRPMPERLTGLAWSLGTVSTSLLLHFNFKAWMPLVNPVLFDKKLAATDDLFGSLVPRLIQFRHALSLHASGWGLNVDLAYHQLFLLLFFVSLGAHAILDTPVGLRHIVLSLSLILLLGGCLYWILPAKGPFVFRPVESTAARVAQQTMSGFFDEFVRTRTVPKGYFIAPLAAMPSLHVAHTLLFCIYAWRRFPMLLVIFIPSFAWIVIEAIAAGWHYVLDLAAGWLLTLVALRIVDGLFASLEGWKPNSARHENPAGDNAAPDTPAPAGSSVVVQSKAHSGIT
jgi:hypothetical protein